MGTLRLFKMSSKTFTDRWKTYVFLHPKVSKVNLLLFLLKARLVLSEVIQLFNTYLSWHYVLLLFSTFFLAFCSLTYYFLPYTLLIAFCWLTSSIPTIPAFPFFYNLSSLLMTYPINSPCCLNLRAIFSWYPFLYYLTYTLCLID